MEGFSWSWKVDLSIEELTGDSENGAALGGEAGPLNSAGGVLGIGVPVVETGITGEAERAFFASSGEGGGCSSFSSSSSSPLMGRLANGELLVGRVEGRATPSKPRVGPEEPTGGADDARLAAKVADLESVTAELKAGVGEPGGVVLPERTKGG